MEQTKFTNLEVEIITDRPEECIVECSCQFYEDYLIKVYGDSNKTKDIILNIQQIKMAFSMNVRYTQKMQYGIVVTNYIAI